ncbi:uncharacterized protein PADG_11983 [Paracoccidioides brasiliensis Pb18]|uniref:Uncharacterized protein n=1 Tax=Paracoccidioides brasiliensis (strain Pb18) TaxID=502780 RepID=A0A0A0HUZ3_PARBD|nr:uncharacterized protein PADG_11983 [Paracoccidioides brasiliensis Pb18]KGM91846.1 hypothetical protein PADG_11983 [Paracoccidioides brasiliensis Pb18]ODH51643.1 hypothetical protein GX48_02108 [Paracoccidioides brasiliensis]
MKRLKSLKALVCLASITICSDDAKRDKQGGIGKDHVLRRFNNRLSGGIRIHPETSDGSVVKCLAHSHVAGVLYSANSFRRLISPIRISWGAYMGFEYDSENEGHRKRC